MRIFERTVRQYVRPSVRVSSVRPPVRPSIQICNPFLNRPWVPGLFIVRNALQNLNWEKGFNIYGWKFVQAKSRWTPGLQTLNIHCHTFPFIFKYLFTSERMEIHILLYFSFILKTFIFHYLLIHFNFEDESLH